VTPLLRHLHSLKIPERIKYKLWVLVYRCLNGTGPDYLARDLRRVADLPSRQRLRPASTAELVVPATRRKALGDRSFPVAAARAWNALPSALTSSPSLSTFRRSLKTKFSLNHFSYNLNSPTTVLNYSPWLLFTYILPSNRRILHTNSLSIIVLYYIICEVVLHHFCALHHHNLVDDDDDDDLALC
jgi:hypothetical protein